MLITANYKKCHLNYLKQGYFFHSDSFYSFGVGLAFEIVHFFKEKNNMQKNHFNLIHVFSAFFFIFLPH